MLLGSLNRLKYPDDAGEPRSFETMKLEESYVHEFSAFNAVLASMFESMSKVGGKCTSHFIMLPANLLHRSFCAGRRS